MRISTASGQHASVSFVYFLLMMTSTKYHIFKSRVCENRKKYIRGIFFHYKSKTKTKTCKGVIKVCAVNTE